MKMANPKKE